MTTVFVGMPSATGFPHPEVMLNIFNQVTDAKIVFNKDSLEKRKPVQNARNDIVKKFLRSDCDWLWFVDDDNPPNLDVLQNLLDAKKDFVTALVPLRTVDNLNVFRNGKHVNSFNVSEPYQQIDNCGTGCVLLSRKMLQEVSDLCQGNPYRFEFEKKAMRIGGEIVDYAHQELYEEGWQDNYVCEDGKIKVVDAYISEDLYFGKQAEKLGYKPYVSVLSVCKHYVNEAPAKEVDKRNAYRLDTKLSIVIPTLKQKHGERTFYEEVIENIESLKEEIGTEFGGYEIITVEGKLVNDAWNEGVAKAKGDYVMVINDDIIIRKGCFEQFKKHADTGRIWCPYFTAKDDFSTLRTNNGDNIVGFCFGFRKKDSMFPIDGRLKIWFGDNWLYHKHGKKIGWGGRIHHYESRTLLSDEHRERINLIIEEDKKHWEDIVNENGWHTKSK